MDYFRSDGQFIYLNKPYAEFYIPQSYFESKFAEDQGTSIKVMGIFNVGFFENDKLAAIKVINLPTWIHIFLYDYDNRKVELPGESEPVPCRVIKYFKDNKIMNSASEKLPRNPRELFVFMTFQMRLCKAHNTFLFVL